MGSTASRPSPLAPTFERMTGWDVKAARRLLAEYKEKDLDFGLDAQGLAEICGGDHAWAESIIDAFGGTNGIVNALAFICGAILVSCAAALEKAGLVFDALDFDMTEQISMDEMTIVFLCCARGFCVMSSTGNVPSDEQLESMTLQAYRELSKSAGQSIAKTEFTTWVLKFVAAAPTAVPHAEVSLDDMAVQFGLVVPAARSLAEEVLSELAAEDNAAASEAPIPQVDAAADRETPNTPARSEALGVSADEPVLDETTGDAESAVAKNDSELGDPAEVDGGGAGDEMAPPEPRNSEQQKRVEYADEFQQDTPRSEVVEEEVAVESPVDAPVFEPAIPDAPPMEADASGEEVSVVETEAAVDEEPVESASDDVPPAELCAEEEEQPVQMESPPLEPASDAAVPADLNAYDAYDYTLEAYDSSSGLPPPDPMDQLGGGEEEDQAQDTAAPVRAEVDDGEEP